jgi:hypothetical protein
MAVDERLTGNLTVDGTITQAGVSVQPTLVSGTNIKTINGSSVLGSGDLVVSGGGGGGRHIPIKPVTGFVYSNLFTTGTTTFGNSVNAMYLVPFIPSNTLTIVSASIQVATLAAASTMKIVLYSDNNGVPQTKLFESTALDISTTGYKTYLINFTFTAGTTYWLGTVANTSTGAVTSNTISIVIANTLLSNGSFNAMTFTIAYPTIPTTLTPTSASFSSIASIPRVTFVSA